MPSGLVLAPFRGLRYDLRRAGELASLTAPPYDVIDDAGVRDLLAASPYNVVRLILPRAEDGAGPYENAARTLTAWREAGILRADPEPALYVYEENDAGHLQRGLVGAVGLHPPDAGVILPHENTMAGPVADRLALTAATFTNTEPIFLVYDGGGMTTAAVAAAVAAPPLAAGMTPDGVTHRLWAITDPAVHAAIAADLAPRRATIADGHHRYATYLRFQEDRHAAGAGPGPWDYGLALLVDAAAAGPRVEAIHRVLPGLPVTEAARRAATAWTVTPLPDPPGPATLNALARAAGPAFVLAGDGQAMLLTAPDQAALAAALDSDHSAAWRSLDVTVAHRWLIPAVLGVPDTEESVGYEHDLPDALTAAARSGGTALLLAATPVASVLAVAASGERMPRKSTLFTPKPRSGIVLRPLDLG
ncbi:MAG: DUF1015 family protein [Mycobacteriales bacterium]